MSNVHLYMLLPHFAFPAQAPSVTSIAAVFDAHRIAECRKQRKVGKYDTTRLAQRDEHDDYEEDGNEDAGGIDGSE